MVRPDPTNIKTLLLFFKENEFLTTTELASLARRSVSTIRLWRKRCGIVSNGNGWGAGHAKRPFIGVSKRREPIQVVDRSIWNTKEWFWQKHVVEGIGVHKLASLINRDERIVHTKLSAFGIPRRTFEEASCSKNPCCTREWLEEHYEVYGFTLRKCAKLAGVTPFTICNWLAKFNIHIRDHYEAVVGERNPCYGRNSKNSAAIRHQQVPATSEGQYA